MSDLLEHYDRASLPSDLDTMLAAAFPDDRRLTPVDLAPLDQFHSRGILATAELAERAGIDRTTRVLDVGSGVGGPARFLAATYGCRVTGIDLSPSFVAAARALTVRTGLTDLVSFEVGDALQLPFAPASFDCVTMHHVAMNIADRAALYAGIRRVLAGGGRLVTYDVVRGAGDLSFRCRGRVTIVRAFFYPQMRRARRSKRTALRSHRGATRRRRRLRGSQTPPPHRRRRADSVSLDLSGPSSQA